jgi:hypothetical protein
MRGSKKLIALTAGVAVCFLAASVLHAPTLISAILAFALLASLGYVWTEVILQGRASTLELVSVAVGLVLAVPVLGGIVLYEAHVSLDRVAWSYLLGGLTLVGDAVLVFRGPSNVRERDYRERPEPMYPRANPQSAQRVTSQPRRREKSRPHVSPWQASACVLAALIAGSAVWVARAGATSQQNPGFTELWLVNKSHSTSIDNLGVINHEGKTEEYQLVLLQKGKVSKKLEFTLAADQTWQQTVQIKAATRANLYLLPDLSRPYRYVDTGP